MENSIFKICCVGCGDMSIRGHGPALKHYKEANPGVELTACCDIDETRATDYREKFGFNKYYTNMQVMLDTEKPDAVCLVVPVCLTAKMAVEVMEKGYPVIMEKPPGMNRDETLKIIEAAKKYNVHNRVAFNRRYMPIVQTLKNYLEKSFKPEEIQNIQCYFSRVGRHDADFSTTAIHGIDTVKFIAESDYKRVKFVYQDFDVRPAQLSHQR